ncbi:PAS domain-containing protein [Paucibacter sp. O1-1]|nr:PAS domain-containing protein [Paucibacter sp. O1-1]MDA3826679.1 PAS domain-containing protein [Paucibacter sp. O1-1]
MSPPDALPTPQLPSTAICPRIVGLGASAGGLVALEQFLAQVPARSGLAYIVVQHLDPTQKALLAELLQRVTSLPVRQAEAQQRIEPDSVYVIAPNTELSVAAGRLQLTPPSEPRGLRLPIDVLFSSLAREQGRQAIAVVLSGMGADGTLGLQAVHAVGGLGAAQTPETAQFDAMPRSAIAAGGVALVAPPQELPGRILSWLAREPAPAALPGDLQRIFGLLRQRTRHDFSLYKPSTLHRRIERRMAIHALATLAGYADFLAANPQEVELLFKELLIGVTSFFRDAPVWQQLAEQTLPELLARRAGQTQLRAWVVGCSTGEEAYSLAMVFAEVVQRLPQHRGCSLQIFASDLSPDAISSARRGQYPATLREQLSPQRLARFFTEQEGGYRIGKNIRDSVLFAQHDVLLDPPFTKLDLLCCRNLMIYFNAALQRRLLPLFHYSLRPGGVLLLGSSETVGRFTHLFGAIESKLRLYLRQDHAAAGSDFLMTSFPPLSKLKQESTVSTANSPAAIPDGTEGLQVAADHLLLQVHAPPAVVVNPAGDIVYISGRTGKYLEPAAGKANWNFHAMVREGLRAPVGEALRQVALQDEPVLLRGLQLPAAPGVQTVDVTVQAVREPGVLQGMVMIVFRDVAAPPAGRGRRKTPAAPDASAELQQCRDEIQALREEARATKEELQSANEELQSTNEELQSANEELTTSKEEMQSMNEELQTVNAEMQTKLDDLALAQSDMRNLLNSTDIAMLFLDQGLNVRRFTERASKLINLRDSDIGRPLSDLTTSLQYPDLHEDAHETLRTLVFSEKQILSSEQRWFSVRIMPYRRLDNVIDGAVITFVDITATKELEARLRLASKG